MANGCRYAACVLGVLGALHVYSVHYVCSVHYVYSVHSVRSVHSVHLVRAVTDRGLPSFCTLQKNPHVWLTFHQVQHPLRLPHKTTLERPKVVRASGAFTLAWTCALRHNAGTFSTSQLPKVLRQWCALYILTSKRASRHIAVHFFGISTSKSGSETASF